MKRLLIAYHSQSGNTAKLAAAACAGARREPGVELRLQRAFDTTLEDLLTCDGVLFGSAEYNGYMSGALKDLFDRTYEPARAHTAGKPYAIVISAGNDGTFAVQAIERIARGYGFKPIAEPIIVVGEVTRAAEERCEELGEMFAAGLGLGIV
jgi:multimeric flavodoxin WrbA